MGEIAGLMRYTEKGQPGISLSEAVLVTGAGMEGDIHMGAGRHLSLITVEARQRMDEQPVMGLCFKRFKENILLKAVDTSALKAGSLIRVGGASLRVTEGGKSCFPECELYTAGAECSLANGAFFAEVTEGCVVSIGDNADIIR